MAMIQGLEDTMKQTLCALLCVLLLICIPETGESFGKLGKLKSLVSGGDIGKLLERIEKTKNNFMGATNCLRLSRDVLFDIAATSEKKEQLKSKEAELVAAETDEDRERITVQIHELKEDEIERSRKSGEMEKKKLNNQQRKNSGKLGYNLALAIVKDKAALKDGKKIKGDGQKAMESIRKDKVAAARAGTKITQLSSALKNDIPTILTEAPRQIKTLQAFMSANKALKKNNKIEKMGKPKVDDEFEELDF